MELTRRDFLTCFLGAPIALAACKHGPRLEDLDGQIVGRSVDLGHRIWRGQRPPPAPDAWQDIDVVIVGAGAAGLSAAWRLKRAGFHNFVVLELEPEIGGTSRCGANQVSRFPWASHYIPAPLPHNRALILLLREMGIIDGLDDKGFPIIEEQRFVRSPDERIYWHGQWWPGLYPRAGASKEDLRQLAAFQREIDRWVGWRDGKGRRAFAIPTALGSTDPEVTRWDKMSMAEFLDQHGFTSSRLRWLIEYGCRDDYGTTLEATSAWAGLFYHASRVPRPGAESAEIITWPEGNGKLAGYLYSQVRDNVRTGVLVDDIVAEADVQTEAAITGATAGAMAGTMTRADVQTGALEGGAITDGDGRIAVTLYDANKNRPEGYRARKVIYSAPLFLARHLIRDFRDEPPPYLDAFEDSPWMVANLTLRDRPRQVGFPLAWDNVIVDSPSLGYVTATHQSLVDYGPTVFTYYYPLTDPDAKAARTRLLELEWKDWADIILTDLRRVHPDLEPLLLKLDVMRWGHAMVRPRVGFIWGGAREKAKLPHRGIHFAHTDLSGLALFEEAQDHGIRAAEEVLAALGRPVESIR